MQVEEECKKIGLRREDALCCLRWIDGIVINTNLR